MGLEPEATTRCGDTMNQHSDSKVGDGCQPQANKMLMMVLSFGMAIW